MKAFARFTALAATAMLSACVTPAQKETPKAAPAPATPVAVNPALGDPDQRFADALKLMKDKKAKEAQAALAGLAKDFPQFSGPLTDLAILDAQSKQKDKALVEFRQAAAVNPNNATAHSWLGILLREKGDYAGSEQEYLRALALQPDEASIHLNLGVLYEVYLKRPRDALAQYREYQRIAGTDRLVVSAWIKNLEVQVEAPPAAQNPVLPAGAKS